MGRKWLIFFQDTNPLVFRSHPAVLGAVKKNNLEFASIVMPGARKGEAVGGIVHMKNEKKGILLFILKKKNPFFVFFFF